MVYTSRRTLLKGIAVTSLAPSLLTACQRPESARLPDAWQMAQQIRQRIQAPTIPNQEFDVRQFGAVGDGQHDSSEAINDAVQAASTAGGGRVLIPEGIFITGPIHLEDNIELHISDQATLKFVTDPDRYLPAVLTRWEGVELMGLSPLIYAHGKQNIAVTGGGVLDGSADEKTWWPWKWAETEDNPHTQHPARAALFTDAENGVPVADRLYAKEAYLRPPFIQFYACDRILIEDVTIKESPFWLINPVLSSNITVRGVTCHSYGPNNDGCNPESCTDVLIENCLFDTGDDCIAIKSGRNADGRRINTPSKNIVVANCNMKAGHGGVVMGSELSGGIENVFVENCQMSSPELWSSIRIKTNAMRGGFVRNINVRNIDIGTVRDMLLINFYYEEGLDGDYVPDVRNVRIQDVHCANAQRILNVRGFDHAKINDLALENVTIDHAAKPSIVENVGSVSLKNMKVDGRTIQQLSDLDTEPAA